MLQITEGRKCGGCTACCFTHSIEAMNKPAQQWCQACNVGRGCQIYETKPAECNTFKCLWLTGVGLDDHRPDKIGVVASVVSAGRAGKTLQLFEVFSGALKSETVSVWVVNNLEKGNPVLLVPIIEEPHLIIPKSRYLELREMQVEFGGIGGMRWIKVVPGI